MAKLTLKLCGWIILSGVYPVFSYQVNIGVLCTPKSAVSNLDQWGHLAASVDGINSNTAPFKPKKGYPGEDDKACSPGDSIKLMKAFNKDALGNLLTEFPRVGVYHPLIPHKPTIEEEIKRKFDRIERKFGGTVTSFMIYDAAKDIKGERMVFEFTDDEIRECRRVLDENGWPDVQMVFNVRNNGSRSRKMALSPWIDEIMIESSMKLWDANSGHIKEFLRWFWQDPVAGKKRLLLQIPCHHDAYGKPDAYIKFRRLLLDLSDLMGVAFMRSDNVVFMPVTYNNPALRFYPELDPEDSDKYFNSMTGLALSIIEQKDLFESRNGPLTRAITDSYQRKPSDGPGRGQRR